MKPRDVLASLRLEDGRPWIDAATDEQLEDALAVLEGDRPYGYQTRARGGSKTTDLAGCGLAALIAADERLRAFWLAADQDQGRLAIDVIAGFVSRTPQIACRVEVQARRVVVPASGATLEVLAADAPSAWGLTPHWLFVDELANWHDGASARRLWEAASSAIAKRADARLVVLTTAGSPDHFAHRVLEHAKQSPLWRVSERTGPPPWMDPQRLDEQRDRLPQAVYEQLFENRWTQAEGSFLDPALIDAAFTLEDPALDRGAGSSYVAGLDLGHVSDRSAFALGHREGQEVHLDRLQVWQGSRATPVDFGELERFVCAAHERFRFTLRLDPWQAISLAQRLRERGIRTEEFHFGPASKQRLAASLLDGINTGTLKLYPADGLREELLGLRLKQTSAGAWTFDHGAAGHDDRAVAIALMLIESLEHRPRPWYPMVVESDDDWLHEHGFRREGNRPVRVSPGEAAAARKADDP